ncbi:MAG TPA: acetyl-CoA carboxylase carboxyltransferase subunit alpha [Phycisphaerales bacterium]|nr:acetyl-CoA carboxylase carboxyltransferase subunit alpha [Phycisphaerales bacterium]HIB50492.1 acetyl-CoA carboxylase carboxyltransferase subunit alpha [Phycisphaerales bacterium]HIN84371.1 acetyl-CoA carboxylase carboxyltransferase subunit alpha [Phycisphaerales bacterium]HIO19658.1 acetyl-CoA carboxylase carboxyltransferase subunit alpha [Phycisphaerales bacterium]
MSNDNGNSITPLPFESPVTEIDKQIQAMSKLEDADAYQSELEELQKTRDSLLKKLYENLTPWQTVQVARHKNRPQTTDYIRMICRDFRELHGDRHFGDDPAIITGFARIGSHKVMVIGHQKGKDTDERIACHFGCAHPEGYRKALAKMKLAEKFGLPVVTFIDTPGAYPGLKAEERGQAQAIALNLKEMSRLKTPIVSVVIGEGGSGGALGLGVADRVAMLQNSWYSVISPEGCAAILWKIANEETNQAAAAALALTSRDNLKNGIIDAIIQEPIGGAQRDNETTATNLEKWIVDSLTDLERFNPQTLVHRRYEKFTGMGVVSSDS